MSSIDDTCDDLEHHLSTRRLNEGRFYTPEEWQKRIERIKSMSLFDDPNQDNTSKIYRTFVSIYNALVSKVFSRKYL